MGKRTAQEIHAHFKDFVRTLDLNNTPSAEVLKKVVQHEFDGLLALDHLIPKNLPDRFSDMLFEGHGGTLYLLQWPHGGPGTEIHDHGTSAGACVVLCGTVHETLYTPDGVMMHQLEAGKCIAFPAQYIHKFQDGGLGEGLSLHFYHPPLKHMNFYRYNNGVLVKSGEWNEAPPQIAAT